MELRKHQQQIVNICCEIMEGKSIQRIYADVTPGGGKSAIPVILANTLLRKNFGNKIVTPFAQKIIWVVPRSSLQIQGEAEFTNPFWDKLYQGFGDKQKFQIRIADNTEDPSRGTYGYVTTYQAISARSWLHQNEITSSPTILFLDEPHHISKKGESSWHDALLPMVEKAKLVVFASGTFSRGDGNPISFLPYKDGTLDIQDTQTERVIRYTRTDALKEKAILPIQFFKLGGRAEWEKEGQRGQANLATSNEREARAALYTALRTEYAFHLLDQTYKHWINHKKSYPFGKLLIVAPDISHAIIYLQYLKKKVKHILIATSSDDKEAKNNIKLFKGSIHNVLVTVAMAYEGMNVPNCTHIACLTGYRSIPWLEQCFARANRVHYEKKNAFVFVPNDKQMLAAIEMIDREQVSALGTKKGNPIKNELFEVSESMGGNSIVPISSQMDFDGILFDNPKEVQKETTKETHSEKEKRLRDKINKYVCSYCRGKGWNPRVLNSSIKKVFGKSRSLMDVLELSDVLDYIKKEYEME